jgi:hypothetical protein
MEATHHVGRHSCIYHLGIRQSQTWFIQQVTQKCKPQRTIQTPHLQPLPSCMFFNGTHIATVTTLTLLYHKSKCGEQSDRFQMSENLLTSIAGSDESRNYNNKVEN